MKLIEYTDPLLRQIAHPVSDFGSDRLASILDQMEQVRVDNGGIGLAAPQVGISERIIIIEVPEGEMVGFPEVPGFEPTVLINPEIIWESEEHIKLPEACLSLPGLMGNVSRPSSIQVQASLADGTPVVIQADKWLARVLWHEIDHLDGILFPDRIDDPAELWLVETVSIDHPVWSHNPSLHPEREPGDAVLA